MAVSIFALAELASAQVQGPFEAKVKSSLQSVPVTWTEATSGTYRYEYTAICATYLYHFVITDHTPGHQGDVVDFWFSTSVAGCAVGAPTVQLIAGHQYELWLDVALGQNPTTCDAGVDLCRAKIHFNCQGN